MTIYCGVCAWLSLLLVSGIFVLVFGVLFLIDIFFNYCFVIIKLESPFKKEWVSKWRFLLIFWKQYLLAKIWLRYSSFSAFVTCSLCNANEVPCSNVYNRKRFWSLAGSEVRRESCLLSQMATSLNWVIIENARDIFWRYWNERENIVFNLLT